MEETALDQVRRILADRLMRDCSPVRIPKGISMKSVTFGLPEERMSDAALWHRVLSPAIMVIAQSLAEDRVSILGSTWRLEIGPDGHLHIQFAAEPDVAKIARAELDELT